MSLDVPDLDDRDFEALFEEARKRIPVHSDTWTDHNTHDPGITLIELFAWLAETYGYQLDQVTDAHRRKYLALLGETPLPPVPATVELELAVPSSLAGTELAAGTTVTADTGQALVGFETADPVVLAGTPVARIVSSYRSGRTDNTTANGTDGLSFAAFGPTAEPGSHLYLGFDADPFTGDALDLHVTYDPTVPDPTEHGTEETTFEPSVRVDWAYCTDYPHWYRDASWAPLPVVDETDGLYRGGRLRLRAPDSTSDPAFDPATWAAWRATPGAVLGEETTHHWLRAEVVDAATLPSSTGVTEEAPPGIPPCDPADEAEPPTGRYDLPPQLAAIRTDVVTARHRTTVTDPTPLDRTGGGTETTARPGQTFSFPRRPVLEAEVALRDPDAPGTLTPWTPAPDLDAVGPEATAYVLDGAAGVVRFGDNLRGATPPAGREVVATRYVHGGGRVGNVPASAAWTVTEAGFEDVEVTALGDAAGGTEAESVDDALTRLRRDLRTPYRAVTLADYRAVALATPGLRVARATAVVDPEPEVTDCAGHSRVRVVAVPYSTVARPEPSEAFRTAVECHVRRHALLTDRVVVDPPAYVGISVRVEIRLDPDAASGDRTEIVAEAFDAFLDPLTGFDGDGWPFGRPVYPSELYEVVAGVSGVDCAVDLDVTARGGTVGPDGVVEVGPTGLVYPERHEVVVRTDREGCGPGGEPR